MDSPKFVYVVYIRTTPEQLWQALTQPEFTQQYWSGITLKSDWKLGSRVQMFDFEGTPADEGEVLRWEPPRVLSYSWRVPWHPDFKDERPCRVTFQIDRQPQKEIVRLTVTHDDFDPASKVLQAVSNGWPPILSSLKSLLETGQPLPGEKFSIKQFLATLPK